MFQMPGSKSKSPARAPSASDAAVIAIGRNIAARTNAATPNTKFDISADELCLRDASGVPVVVRDVVVTVDMAVVGANGIDTGVQVLSTWYYGWVIAKPGGVGVAGLASTSAASPALPPGYTFKALVTAARSNAGNVFNVYRQFGNEVFYTQQNSLVAAGTSAVEAAITLVSQVPTIAESYQVAIDGRSSFSVGVVSDDNLLLRVVTGINYWTQTLFATTSGEPKNYQLTAYLPNTGNLYYAITRGSTGGTGMTMNLFIPGFTLPMGGF